MKLVMRKVYAQIKEWKYEGRVVAAFLLGMGLCIKNSGTYLLYVKQSEGITQIFEPFIILGSRIPFMMGIMLGGMFLLSDAPFIKPISVYEVLRGGYRQWFLSEVVYIVCASLLYSMMILFSSCIFAACCSKISALNTWSSSIKVLAYQQPEYVVRKYAFAFPYPELLDNVSPLQAVLETVTFQSLYLSLIGMCMMVVNLLSEKNIGWIIAAMIHVLGYIAYANSGMIIPLKYSMLCCASPAFHYINGLNMSVKYSFLLLAVSSAILGFMGSQRLLKTGFN